MILIDTRQMYTWRKPILRLFMSIINHQVLCSSFTNIIRLSRLTIPLWFQYATNQYLASFLHLITDSLLWGILPVGLASPWHRENVSCFDQVWQILSIALCKILWLQKDIALMVWRKMHCRVELEGGLFFWGLVQENVWERVISFIKISLVFRFLSRQEGVVVDLDRRKTILWFCVQSSLRHYFCLSHLTQVSYADWAIP